MQCNCQKQKCLPRQPRTQTKYQERIAQKHGQKRCRVPYFSLNFAQSWLVNRSPELTSEH